MPGTERLFILPSLFLQTEKESCRPIDISQRDEPASNTRMLIIQLHFNSILFTQHC